MKRHYDASRRAAAAERTREAIIAAAFELHGKGITDFESLAKEADVSVATVRKHFPTRELLFESCTAYGTHRLILPDIEILAATPEPAERTRRAVRETYALHESIFGQSWIAFQLEAESASMAAALGQVEELTGVVGALIVDAWALDEADREEARGFVVGMLNPLTYRALRLYGRLSPEQAIEQTTTALVGNLTAHRPTKEVANK
jgi:AcrR family transcriptional regulator